MHAWFLQPQILNKSVLVLVLVLMLHGRSLSWSCIKQCSVVIGLQRLQDQDRLGSSLLGSDFRLHQLLNVQFLRTPAVSSLITAFSTVTLPEKLVHIRFKVNLKMSNQEETIRATPWLPRFLYWFAMTLEMCVVRLQIASKLSFFYRWSLLKFPRIANNETMIICRTLG